MEIHSHELAHLQAHGEVLLIRPVEPQPTLEFPATHPVLGERWFWRHGRMGVATHGFRREDFVKHCPHAPGDVLEVEETRVRPLSDGNDGWGGTVTEYHSRRLTVTSVSCKRVREVTAEELAAAGFSNEWTRCTGECGETPCGVVVPIANLWWDKTYAPLGPEHTWERAWCWLILAELKKESPDAD